LSRGECSLFPPLLLISLTLTCVLSQLSSLPPSELSRPVRYPRSKELTDDEEEISSPKRRKSSPVAEEARASQEKPVAEDPMATVHRGVRGSGGRIRGLGKKGDLLPSIAGITWPSGDRT
jgi:hypothetical protein